METSKRNRIILFLFIILFISGCASVQINEEWKKVNSLSIESIGEDALWQQTKEDEGFVKEEIKKLLSDGLSMDDSTKIALLNNKRLQAAFEDIGIAKADIVQAGLLTNPDLSAIFRFPFHGGVTGIEVGGLLKISDIWQIPIRKQVASFSLEKSIYKILDMIQNTVKEAKIAYLNYAFNSLMRDELERIKDTFWEWKDHIVYRERFGFSSAIDIYMAEAMLADAELEFSRAESDLLISRYRLNRILGLFDQDWDIKIDQASLERIPSLPKLDFLISKAISQRPDIKIAELEIKEAERILSLEKARIFSNVQAGVVYEKDIDSEETIGAEIGLQIPIFDQNQAQIAKADYRLRQRQKELKAKIDEVKEDISFIYERLSFIAQQIDFLKNKIIPLRESAVEYAEKYFNAMELNMLYLLEAKKNLLEAKKNYLNALKDYNILLAGLEKIIGAQVEKLN